MGILDMNRRGFLAGLFGTAVVASLPKCSVVIPRPRNCVPGIENLISSARIKSLFIKGFSDDTPMNLARSPLPASAIALTAERSAMTRCPESST